MKLFRNEISLAVALALVLANPLSAMAATHDASVREGIPGHCMGGGLWLRETKLRCSLDHLASETQKRIEIKTAGLQAL